MANEINNFCDTPGKACTFGYCDENGCQDRKRNYTALGISTLEYDELLKHLASNLANPEQADLVITELMTRLGNRSRPAPAATSVSGGAATSGELYLLRMDLMAAQLAASTADTNYEAATELKAENQKAIDKISTWLKALATAPASSISPAPLDISKLLLKLDLNDEERRLMSIAGRIGRHQLSGLKTGTERAKEIVKDFFATPAALPLQLVGGAANLAELQKAATQGVFSATEPAPECDIFCNGVGENRQQMDDDTKWFASMVAPKDAAYIVALLNAAPEMLAAARPATLPVAEPAALDKTEYQIQCRKHGATGWYDIAGGHFDDENEARQRMNQVAFTWKGFDHRLLSMKTTMHVMATTPKGPTPPSI